MIIRLLVTAGLRGAEIAGIRYVPNNPDRNDGDLCYKAVTVVGKSRRVRVVGLVLKQPAPDRHLRLCAQHPDASLPLALALAEGRHTADGIRQMLERRAKETGLGPMFMRTCSANCGYDERLLDELAQSNGAVFLTYGPAG